MKKSLFLVVLAVLVAVFAVSCDGESAAAEPKKFTVKFDLNGGTSAAIDDQTVVEGEKAKEPAAPTLADHEFKGWKLGEKAFDFNTPITKDITLVASWGGVTPPGPEHETKYTVTFVYDDGTTANQTKEVVKDSKVEKPTDPTREGYAFKGWFEDDATAAFDFDTPITKNLELKAKWEINKYTVTFDVDGDTTTIPAKTVAYGKTATAPEAPTKTGHRFTGWYEDGAAEAFDFGTAITKNITLKAMWVKTYTVTFKTGSEFASSVKNITVDENSKINEPETERPGFRFDGWYSGDDKFDFENTQINIDYELVAKWTQLFIVRSGVLEPTEVGKTLENVVIPESIDGSPVTEIKGYAFQSKQGIVSVEIPSTVTKIGKLAFNNCTGITSVTFGEGSKLGTIGESAFDGCTAITSFKIPASVTTIEKSAFSGCSSMEFVTFSTDSKLDTIGVFAFSSCSGITSFEIPASVTTIGENAFNGCIGLKTITIPSNVKKVGQYAFQNCGTKDEEGNAASGLEEVIILSVDAEYGNGVFQCCYKLGWVEFPDDMKSSISAFMFYQCLSLDDTSIPNGVKGIGKNAFYYTKLKSIKIASDAEVGDDAFPSTCTISYY